MTMRSVGVGLMLAGLLWGCGDGGTDGEATGDSAAPEQIIVSGASGQLGGLVVEELLAGGTPPENLILVSRTPEDLATYAEMGASTRFGDFTEPESLASAYAGGTKLLLISLNTVGNPNPRVASERQELHRTAIEAAVAAGVRHIVYTSFVDAENNTSPIAVDHRATEAMLRESDVAWTSLRNGWYADRLVAEAARMVTAGRALVVPDEQGTAFISRQDCAAAAAAVLTTPGHENRIYELTGELVTGARLAEVASEVTGTAVEVIAAQPEMEGVAALDMPSGTVQTNHFQEITGRAPTSTRQLLEANRAELVRGG